MLHSSTNDDLIKQSLSSAKTVAMVGISSAKKENKESAK